MFPKPISWFGIEKTKPNKTFTNQKKCNTTQNNHKKLKPDLIASYNIRPGNGEGLFLFWRFINLSLTYLLRHLPTYLQPRDPHGAPLTWVPNACGVENISDVQEITCHISEDRNTVTTEGE